MSFWAQKQRHGLHWGYWVQKDANDDGRIHIDNYEPCWDISKTEGDRLLIQFGNTWASKPGDPFYDKPFQHPREIWHGSWRFWDNPFLPHFNWARAHNPTGAKEWVRWSQGTHGTLGNIDLDSHERRINTLLQEFSHKALNCWHHFIHIRSMTGLDGVRGRALIVPCSEHVYTNYYATTKSAWIKGVVQELERMGVDYDIRHKPSRKTRQLNGELTDQLEDGRYAVTISQHSVAAVESIVAGVPAVTTGASPAHKYATPWNEYLQGHLRLWDTDQQRKLCLEMLAQTRHKRELFEGTWRTL